jgi:hypothetical protein
MGVRKRRKGLGQVATSVGTFDDLYGKIIVTDFIAVASGFRSNTVICGFHSYTAYERAGDLTAACWPNNPWHFDRFHSQAQNQ